MMASSYGWAAVVAGILAILGLCWWAIAAGKRAAAAAAKSADLAAGNKVVADANAAAASAGGTDLGATPGVSVHERPKPTGGF